MTLLEEFIFSLSKSLRAKLRPLQFRGVKRKIFLKVLDYRIRGYMDSETMIKRYKLTKKRYYQMLSEILAACYHDLIPKGGTVLLLFFGNKQLFRHFYNEMKKQEAALIAKGDTLALEQYYFRILLKRNLLLLHPTFNKDIVAEFDAYAKRYINIKNHPDPDDALYLRILELSTCIGEPLHGFNLHEITPLVRELEDIFDRVKDGENVLAKYAASNTLMMILSRFHFEGKSPATYAAFGKQLMKNYPDIFVSVKDFYELECLQFLSADEAYKIEQFKYFLTEYAKHFGSSLYYIGCFFPIILRSGEFIWAKKYIEKFFPNNIDLLRSEAALHFWYLLLIYNVYAGKYAEGEKCLQKAFSANTGDNRNVNSDVILRCYEVFFAGVSGDPIALENTTGRNMRYTQRHGYERGETYQIVFLKAVSDLTGCINFDTAKAEQTREKFMGASGEEGLSFLFQKIYDTYFTAKKGTIAVIHTTDTAIS